MSEYKSIGPVANLRKIEEGTLPPELKNASEKQLLAELGKESNSGQTERNLATLQNQVSAWQRAVASLMEKKRKERQTPIAETYPLSSKGGKEADIPA
jgi:hypothetical protein